MLTLDLTNAPRWHDLVPGVRVQLRPLTTTLMVATRSDPAVEAVTEDASDEECAVAFAKALARRAVLAWEGIGNAEGNPIDPRPEAIDALLDVWPIFEVFQLTYVSKACCWSRKNRLRALAEWSFGGGDLYCEACAQVCQDCPARLNRPLTHEGWQVWDLVGRLGGQLRVLPGAVIGLDMSAALSLGDALGVPPAAEAELLPVTEAVMVAKLNEQMEVPMAEKRVSVRLAAVGGRQVRAELEGVGEAGARVRAAQPRAGGGERPARRLRAPGARGCRCCCRRGHGGRRRHGALRPPDGRCSGQARAIARHDGRLDPDAGTRRRARGRVDVRHRAGDEGPNATAQPGRRRNRPCR